MIEIDKLHIGNIVRISSSDFDYVGFGKVLAIDSNYYCFGKHRPLLKVSLLDRKYETNGDSKCIEAKCSPEVVEGVLLTKNILKKNNWIQCEYDYFYLVDKDEIPILGLMKDSNKFNVFVYENINSFCISLEITYVHELQNLLFGLGRTDIKIEI